MASMSGVCLDVVIADDAIMGDKAFKAKNITGSLPLLELDDGTTAISDSIAICKYLARTGPDADGLMGRTTLE